MRPSAGLASLPLFERFHAEALEKQHAPERRALLRGNALCTGNVSLRRADYLAVGGFNSELARSEDQELGLRLERAGVQIVFSEDAYTVHDSDHRDFGVWRRRAFLYGKCDLRIARMHADLAHADPWRFFFGNAVVKRPFVAAAALSQLAGWAIAGAVYRVARVAEVAGLKRAAVRGTGLLWDVEYFRGVRDEAGGLVGTLRSCGDYLRKRRAAADSEVRS
jgi:GT2 family glycosyltransferase